jgi:hypothetical protein
MLLDVFAFASTLGTMRMPHLVLSLLVAVSSGNVATEEEVAPRGFTSPDGRFSVVVYLQNPSASEDAKLMLVDRASGKVVTDLGSHEGSIVSQTYAVWSEDSTRVAYRAGHHREWSTNVVFWDGSAFQNVPLPEELPSPEIKFRKGDEPVAVKNYSGGVAPVRWLPSGDLQLVREETQIVSESSRTYTATVSITIAFNAQRHASVRSVSRSQTRSSELPPATIRRRWRAASNTTRHSNAPT